MHDYIKSLYEEASINGSPLIRPMFYEFPEDAKCWEISDQYMFGPKYLVAPILHYNEFEREVYLPAGRWKPAHRDVYDRCEDVIEGGKTVSVKAPLEYMPVFEIVK